MILFVPQKWLLYSNVIYNFFIYLFLFYCYHLIFYFASELKLMIKDSCKRFHRFSITTFSHCFVPFLEFPSFKELCVFIYIWNISLSRHETTFLFNIKLRNILCHPPTLLFSPTNLSCITLSLRQSVYLSACQRYHYWHVSVYATRRHAHAQATELHSEEFVFTHECICRCVCDFDCSHHRFQYFPTTGMSIMHELHTNVCVCMWKA